MESTNHSTRLDVRSKGRSALDITSIHGAEIILWHWLQLHQVFNRPPCITCLHAARAQTFCRKFLWHELQLWAADLPRHALIVLSHADDLVPAPLVAAHVAESAPSASIMYHPTAGHGGFLADLPFQRRMVAGIAALLAAPVAGPGKADDALGSPSLMGPPVDSMGLPAEATSGWQC